MTAIATRKPKPQAPPQKPATAAKPRSPAEWQQIADAMALPLSRMGYALFGANRAARSIVN